MSLTRLTQPSHNEAHRFTMRGAALVNAIGRTMGAISTEETRYYLNGIYMHTIAGELRFVATDGHRMYIQEMSAPDGATDAMAGVIIPRKTVALIHKLTKGKATPDSFTMAVTDSRVQFAWESVDGIAYMLTSKVIDGTFPDYQRVMPKYNANAMIVGAAEFDGAIKDVSLVASEKGRAVKLTLSPNGGQVSCTNPDQGTASAVIDSQYTGDPIEIGFNARYLTEIIAAAGSDTIKVEMQDCGAPALITGDIEGWKAVLMPMRV